MSFHVSHLSHKCYCGRKYQKLVDLREHRIAQKHPASHLCSVACNHPPPPAKNRTVYRCDDCNKPCATKEILSDHQIARDHCYCSECNLKFDTANLAREHQKKFMHASEFKCCDCNISFKNNQALLAHVENVKHRIPLKEKEKKTLPQKKVVVKNEACEKCSKKFATPAALQAHQKSTKHHPFGILTCPFDENCEKTFTSPSALTQHLESGKCKSGLNRDKIYQMVQQCDTNDNIHHKPQIANTSSSFSTPINTPPSSSASWVIPSETGSDWSPLLTPDASEFGDTDSLDQWSLLESSQVSLRSGGIRIASATLHCTLCPPTRKPFANMKALEQHLSSAAHCSKLYHCPSTFLLDPNLEAGKRKHNERSFSTLSGLAMHLESGACRGGKKAFLQCMDIIQGHLKMFGLGGLKLLVGTGN